jgi:hypothetical protein
MPEIPRLVAVTPPAAIVDNASLVTNVVDTAGFRFARIVLFLGATDIALTNLRVQEADAITNATTLTSGVDITDLVVGTATTDAGGASALPSATADNTFQAFEIDLRGRRRYLKLIATVGDGAAGAFAAAWAELHRAEKLPITAAEKGCGQVMKSPKV